MITELQPSSFANIIGLRTYIAACDHASRKVQRSRYQSRACAVHIHSFSAILCVDSEEIEDALCPSSETIRADAGAWLLPGRSWNTAGEPVESLANANQVHPYLVCVLQAPRCFVPAVASQHRAYHPTSVRYASGEWRGPPCGSCIASPGVVGVV